MFKKNYFLIFIAIIFMNCTGPEMKVELVLDTQSSLGEGAIWNYKTGQLYWIDINNKILNIYDPSTGINKELLTGQLIGTVVPSESGKAIIALQNGIYVIDVSTGSKTFIADPEADIPDNRFNDGKCDPAGRLWVGTMKADATGTSGSLYRMDHDGTISKMIGDVGISNGIVWSADQKTMYYIDSPTQRVMAYDFNVETGEITNGKIIIEIPPETGLPDGMTIDEEGNLWIALYGGHAVGCWNPETGKLIQKIDVPAKNITSCAFAGPNLSTLYITTARQEMSDEELEEYPLSGGLFKTNPGVKGVHASFFKGDF